MIIWYHPGYDEILIHDIFTGLYQTKDLEKRDWYKMPPYNFYKKYGFYSPDYWLTSNGWVIVGYL